MLRNFLLMSLLVFIIIFAILKSAFGETNTVSSTVVTNNTPPTANSPSVVVNNSDVCKTAVAGAVQTQIPNGIPYNPFSLGWQPIKVRLCLAEPSSFDPPTFDVVPINSVLSSRCQKRATATSAPYW